MALSTRTQEREQIKSDTIVIKRIKYADYYDMRLDGMTFNQIASVKGKTQEAVRQIIKRYFPEDIEKRHAKTKQKQDAEKAKSEAWRISRLNRDAVITQLRREGKTIKCIKNTLNISEGTVQNVLKIIRLQRVK